MVYKSAVGFTRRLGTIRLDRTTRLPAASEASVGSRQAPMLERVLNDVSLPICFFSPPQSHAYNSGRRYLLSLRSGER